MSLRPMVCPCGRPATHRRDGSPVCQRCEQWEDRSGRHESRGSLPPRPPGVGRTLRSKYLDPYVLRRP